MVKEENILEDLLSSAGQKASAVSNQVESWVQGDLSVEDVFKKPLVNQEQINTLDDGDMAIFNQIKSGVENKFNTDTSTLEKMAAHHQGITAETGANTIAFIVVENSKKAKDNGISFLLDAVQEKAAIDGWGKALIAGAGALVNKVTSYFTDVESKNELLSRATEMAVMSASLDNGRILSGLMDSKADAIKIAQGIESSAVSELGIKDYKSVFTSEVVNQAYIDDGRNEGRATPASMGNSRHKSTPIISEASASKLDASIQDITDEYRDNLVSIGYTDKQAFEAAQSLYKGAVSSSSYIKNGNAYSAESGEHYKLGNYGGIRDKAMVLSDDYKGQIIENSNNALQLAVSKIDALHLDVNGSQKQAVSNSKLEKYVQEQNTILAEYRDGAMKPRVSRKQARDGHKINESKTTDVAQSPSSTRYARRNSTAKESQTFAGGATIMAAPEYITDTLGQTAAEAQKKADMVTHNAKNSASSMGEGHIDKAEALAAKLEEAKNATARLNNKSAPATTESSVLEDVNAGAKLEKQDMPLKPSGDNLQASLSH